MFESKYDTKDSFQEDNTVDFIKKFEKWRSEEKPNPDDVEATALTLLKKAVIEYRAPGCA